MDLQTINVEKIEKVARDSQLKDFYICYNTLNIFCEAHKAILHLSLAQLMHQ